MRRLAHRRLPPGAALRAARSSCSGPCSTGTPSGSRWGWSARASSCRPRRRRFTPTVELARRCGPASIRPRLYLIPDGYPRALSAGRGARGGAALALSSGLLGVATPAELEGIVAHELAHLRNRDVLTQTVAAVDRRRDRRVLADRRLLPARLPLRSRAARGVVRPSRRSRRTASTRPIATPPSSATRRTGSPTGCSGSSSRWGSSRSRRARRPSRSTRPIRSPRRGSGGALRHASAARRARPAAARARSRLAREARAARALRHAKRAPCAGP